MNSRHRISLVLVGLFLVLSSLACASGARVEVPVEQTDQRPILLAHYMPWYATKPPAIKWGWHWTMNHFDPEVVQDGRQQAASQYRPMIGLYDSSDLDVLEYHVLLMKYAGLDGVAVDWYGTEDHYDYADINRNTLQLLKVIEKAKMKFSIVYEDQTVTQLIKGGKYKAEDAVQKGAELFKWMEVNFFSSPSYLKIEQKPVVMVFGPQYYKDGDWPQMFSGLETAPEFFTLMSKRSVAAGAFSWPTPQNGEEKSWDELKMFQQRAGDWKEKVGVAYPRFKDIYAEAGAQPGFPPIEDHGGRTFKRTLSMAMDLKPAIIQFATWNDWGEGTQIEPSVEFGYRDLETTQAFRAKLAGGFTYSPADLRLPLRLFQLRKKYKGNKAMEKKMDGISDKLFAGDSTAANKALAEAK
jgi:hypothetical protein